MQKQRFWHLDKSCALHECEILSESSHNRSLRLLEGPEKGKTVKAHPEGVSWGKLFPRVFQTSGSEKPGVFVAHSRAILRKPCDASAQSAVPKEMPSYRFQPFIADVIDSIHQGQSVILTGGTGVGKTTHITQLAARANQPLLRINFNGETRMSDLIGKVHVLAGETKWIDGVLPMAMRRGWWLLLDELDFAEPAVLSLLHPVLEEESMLVLKENNGEIIRPHPNFRLFATANSIGAMSERSGSYAGTNQMNEAFLDRWQVIMVDNLSVDEEVQVLRQSAPGLKPAWAKLIAQFASKAREKSCDDDSVCYSGDNFSTRKSIAWAKKAALHRNPVKGAKLSWLDKLPESEQEPMEKALMAWFGTGKRSASRSSARKKA